MIGFIGLSHLGLNYSLATAAKGFVVAAYDPDPAQVLRLQEGVFPIDEPGFVALHGKCRENLRYTSDLTELRDCALVFYALDVRTSDTNESDLGPLSELIEATASRLASGTTVVVLSQVRPGYSRRLAAKLQGAAATRSLQLYYQVETLIFGAAVQRAMEPERYIIGAETPGAPLPSPYREWLEAFGCPVLVMRLESAELAKIAINFYLVSTVSTTNTLAEICEAIGADWSEIAPALRLDKRIGPFAYLKPGLGIAGGNLERDLVTVQGLAAEHGTEAGIINAWQENSAHAKSWALRTLKAQVLKGHEGVRIALWGLAYKQDTHSVKNSAALELIKALPACAFHAYDPVARVDTGDFPNLTIHDSALKCLDQACALAVMTPWREFSNHSAEDIRSAMSGTVVVDPYGLIDGPRSIKAGLNHRQIGRAAEATA
jgi:UDPglucose 6-dehydrogenase